MIVAGVMSGTSADGINVALVRLGESHSAGLRPASVVASTSRGRVARAHTTLAHTGLRGGGLELLGHFEYAYPAKVRTAILAAMNAQNAQVADLGRLNFLLGELYADAVRSAERKLRVKAELVGCHGQTLYHQGDLQSFLGKKIAATWQTGEAAVIAARVGAPVVSDFRPADMAAGGTGAPLVPYLDYLLFRDSKIGRIAQNIGGIANLTAIPAGAGAEQVVAFDTGPGNMVIDAVTEALFDRRFDRGGKIAASGNLIEPVLQLLLARDFFRRKPPKTAGREEFGREFIRDFLRQCGRAPKADVVATATALTVRSVADAVRKLVIGKSVSSESGPFREMILSGGGAKNHTLVRMLTEAVARRGLQVRFSDDFGLPTEAKEAVAFAVMAYETWNRRPSNVPSATGANRLAILGKISYA
jgi:anhydro-N-acetylmuramic acid kinase